MTLLRGSCCNQSKMFSFITRNSINPLYKLWKLSLQPDITAEIATEICVLQAPVTDPGSISRRTAVIKANLWRGGGGVILGHPVCSIPSGILSFTLGNEQEMLVVGVCPPLKQHIL